MGRRESGKKEDRRQRRREGKGERGGETLQPYPIPPSATSLSASSFLALPAGACSFAISTPPIIHLVKLKLSYH